MKINNKILIQFLTIVFVIVNGAIIPTEATSKAKIEKNNKTQISATKKTLSTKEKTYLQFLKDRDVAKAKKGYLQAYKEKPSNAEPLFNLAVLSESEEKWDDAIKYFKNYLKLAPKSKLAIKAKREIVLIEGIKKQDKTPDGKKERQYNQLITKAKYLLKSGLMTEAIIESGEAAKLKINVWEPYAITATALYSKGMFEQAKPFFEKSLEYAPEDKKQIIQASIDSNKTELDSLNFSIEGAKALTEKNYPVASEKFTQALNLKPERSDYKLFIAMAFTFDNKFTDAKSYLSQILEDPNPSISKKAKELNDGIEQKEKEFAYIKGKIDLYNQKVQDWSETYNSINSSDFSNKYNVVHKKLKDLENNPFSKVEPELRDFTTTYNEIKQKIEEISSKLNNNISNYEISPILLNTDSLISKEDKLFSKTSLFNKNMEFVFNKIEEKRLAREKQKQEKLIDAENLYNKKIKEMKTQYNKSKEKNSNVLDACIERVDNKRDNCVNSCSGSSVQCIENCDSIYSNDMDFCSGQFYNEKNNLEYRKSNEENSIKNEYYQKVKSIEDEFKE